MTVASTAALVLVPLPLTMVTPVLVVTIVSTVMLVFLVSRNILAFIPAVPHEIDPLAAGLVRAAIPAPVLRLAGRNVEIDRRTHNRHPLDDHWLPVDELWRRITTDVHVTIEAGLADADRYANLGGKYRQSAGGAGGCQCDGE
jgi:hypothetical protein